MTHATVIPKDQKEQFERTLEDVRAFYPNATVKEVIAVDRCGNECEAYKIEW